MITAVLAFFTGSPWRAAAIALALALAVSSGALWVQTGRLEAAQESRGAAQAALAVAQDQLKAARGSAVSWEVVARDLQVRLNTFVRAQAVQQAAADQAVATAVQAEREASAAFAAWLARYERATRSEECAAQKRMRLCTE